MFTFKDYFSKRRLLGFYFPLVAALLSLAVAFFDLGYAYSRYFHIAVFCLFLAGGLSYFILSFFRITERFAAIPLLCLDLVGFFAFIRHSYLYFSEVFYGGFKFESLFAMEPIFAAILYLSLLAIILAHFGFYSSPRKQVASAKEGK